MPEQRNTSFTVSDEAPSTPLSESSVSISHQHPDTLLEECNFSKGEGKTGIREIQSYLVCGHWYPHLVRCQAQVLTFMCQMTLDKIDIEGDKEQTKIFTQYTIDAVCASYAAARNRVHQYTQLAKIYQWEADDSAVKLEKAGHIMPDYKPAWWTACSG
jgi:hypothetical protein